MRSCGASFMPFIAKRHGSTKGAKITGEPERPPPPGGDRAVQRLHAVRHYVPHHHACDSMFFGDTLARTETSERPFRATDQVLGRKSAREQHDHEQREPLHGSEHEPDADVHAHEKN